MFVNAIARRPSVKMSEGITTSTQGLPDYDKALSQFNTYIKTLESSGLMVQVLDPSPDFPDAHFVEDTAVVTPDVAILANPGAPARNGEQHDILPYLARHRKTAVIEPPGKLDGGDVLMVGTHFFIGISDRTNVAGAGALGAILSSYGNTFETIPVGAGLHFKSDVNYVGKNTLLMTNAYSGHSAFDGYDKIIVDSTESYAANTLLINNTLLTPKGFPNTRKKLEPLGFDIITLDMSEFRKMDGGLTCLSIRF